MATGTTAFYDNTVADVFVPEVWSKEEIVARESRLVFANLFDRRFEADVSAAGDTIHVPSIGNLAARTKDVTAGQGGNVASTGSITYETITETNTDITISRYIFSAIAINRATKRQANRDLMSAYAPKMGYALGLDTDDTCAGLPDDFSNVAGTLAQELTYDDVLRGIQYLDDADAPQEDRAIVISPAQKAGFMKLDQFVHGDYGKLNAQASAQMKADNIGTWMGLPVLCSTNVEGSNAAGHDCTVFQKQAVALVIQMTPRTEHFYDIDVDADKVASFELYGTKEMRDDHGVWLKGA